MKDGRHPTISIDILADVLFSHADTYNSPGQQGNTFNRILTPPLIPPDRPARQHLLSKETSINHQRKYIVKIVQLQKIIARKDTERHDELKQYKHRVAILQAKIRQMEQQVLDSSVETNTLRIKLATTVDQISTTERSIKSKLMAQKSQLKAKYNKRLEDFKTKVHAEIENIMKNQQNQLEIALQLRNIRNKNNQSAQDRIQKSPKSQKINKLVNDNTGGTQNDEQKYQKDDRKYINTNYNSADRPNSHIKNHGSLLKKSQNAFGGNITPFNLPNVINDQQTYLRTQQQNSNQSNANNHQLNRNFESNPFPQTDHLQCELLKRQQQDAYRAISSQMVVVSDQNRTLRTDLDTLRQKNSQLKCQIDRMQQQVNNLRSQENIQKQNYRKLQQKQSRIETQNMQFQKQINELRDQCERANKSNRRLQQEYQIQKNQHSKLQKLHGACIPQGSLVTDASSQKLSHTIKSSQKQQKANESIKAEINLLFAESNGLKLQLQTLKNRKLQLERYNQTLKDEIQSNNTQNKAKQMANLQLINQNNNLKTDNEKYKKYIKSIQLEISRLNKQNEIANQENSKLIVENSKLRIQQSQIRSLINGLNNEHSSRLGQTVQSEHPRRGPQNNLTERSDTIKDLKKLQTNPTHLTSNSQQQTQKQLDLAKRQLNLKENELKQIKQKLQESQLEIERLNENLNRKESNLLSDQQSKEQLKSLKLQNDELKNQSLAQKLQLASQKRKIERQLESKNNQIKSYAAKIEQLNEIIEQQKGIIESIPQKQQKSDNESIFIDKSTEQTMQEKKEVDNFQKSQQRQKLLGMIEQGKGELMELHEQLQRNHEDYAKKLKYYQQQFEEMTGSTQQAGRQLRDAVALIEAKYVTQIYKLKQENESLKKDIEKKIGELYQASQNHNTKNMNK